MTRVVLVALAVLALAAPVMAGQNPNVRAFVSFTDPAVADTNTIYTHRTETVDGLVNCYLLVDCFGDGGGMATISLKWETSGFGMAFSPVFQLPNAQQIGGPDHIDGLWVIAGDSCVYPNTFGWVYVLNQPYFVSAPGTITLSANTVDGQMIVDCLGGADQFCVLGNGGLGMDPPAGAVDCDCNTAVEEQTWGSIKALYR